MVKPTPDYWKGKGMFSEANMSRRIPGSAYFSTQYDKAAMGMQMAASVNPDAEDEEENDDLPALCRLLL